MSDVTPARRVAFAVIRRVFEQDAYADRALHGEAKGLDARERSLAMQLAYGTVQRRLTLDHFVEQLARPVSELDPPTLAALRLGLYQLVFLDGVAAHAAVGESVELAKGGRSGGHKLVNAVLRRAARGELPALPRRRHARRRGDRAFLSAVARRAVVGALRPRRDARAAARGQRVRRAGAAREHPARHARRRHGRAGRAQPPSRPARRATSCPRGSSSRAPSTPTAIRSTPRAPTRPSRGRRCSSGARSTRSPASACSTSAPRPAARRRTSPR